MKIPIKWVQAERYTNDDASQSLGRANAWLWANHYPSGISSLVSEKRFPWDQFNTARLLCVLIVRIAQVFHVERLIILFGVS